MGSGFGWIRLSLLGTVATPKRRMMNSCAGFCSNAVIAGGIGMILRKANKKAVCAQEACCFLHLFRVPLSSSTRLPGRRLGVFGARSFLKLQLSLRQTARLRGRPYARVFAIRSQTGGLSPHPSHRLASANNFVSEKFSAAKAALPLSAPDLPRRRMIFFGSGSG